VRSWDANRVAEAAGATLLAAGDGPGPAGASVDTRTLKPGELFVGLPGTREDGGSHAARALHDGAWGVLVSPPHAEVALGAGKPGAVLTHDEPLRGLQALARAWRRELGDVGARVVAITGSTGKTSTKDILAALLARGARTSASPANLNTEIGMPLAMLAAPAGTRFLVLELAMRGAGQIAELTAIAEPDVGVIVNIGPAHLELLGSLEAIAAAKAELIAGLAPGASAVLPAGERLLEPHLREDLSILTFGAGGDVELRAVRDDGTVLIALRGRPIELRPSFHQAHLLGDLLAAVAAADALGQDAQGPLDVELSAMRGQRVELPGGVIAIDDCYNANPMSMRAAIDDLAATAPGRRVAVLGDMLELGRAAPQMHEQLGAHAAERGIGLLVTVGPLAAHAAGAFAERAPAGAAVYTSEDARAAAALLPGLLREGDTVLVKGSRGVGLERTLAALQSARSPSGGRPRAQAGRR
jgi:UDP-N-acetylmuramoyl-tripeptide--D-alanyl-D-alanine ligase